MLGNYKNGNGKTGEGIAPTPQSVCLEVCGEPDIDSDWPI